MTPREILAMRLASGEIGVEEYNRKLELLSASEGPVDEQSSVAGQDRRAERQFRGGVGLPQAVGIAFQHYFDFGGRASRGVYWYFALFSFVGGIACSLVDTALLGFSIDDTGPLNAIFSLALLIPSLSVSVRRLHDIGRSGWWLLIAFTVIGIPVLFYWACQPPNEKGDRYGPLTTL